MRMGIVLLSVLGMVCVLAAAALGLDAYSLIDIPFEFSVWQRTNLELGLLISAWIIYRVALLYDKLSY